MIIFVAPPITSTGGGGEFPTADEIAEAVWDRELVDHTTSGTFGFFVQKLLSVAKFLGLQE